MNIKKESFSIANKKQPGAKFVFLICVNILQDKLSIMMGG